MTRVRKSNSNTQPLVDWMCKMILKTPLALKSSHSFRNSCCGAPLRSSTFFKTSSALSASASLARRKAPEATRFVGARSFLSSSPPAPKNKTETARPIQLVCLKIRDGKMGEPPDGFPTKTHTNHPCVVNSRGGSSAFLLLSPRWAEARYFSFSWRGMASNLIAGLLKET